MIERLPSRADSQNMLSLDPEAKDFMLLTLRNGPGSSKYVFSGRRNRKYLFQRRPGERRHTILIPKSVWDAEDAEVAMDILGRNTGHTIIVQHVTLANPNQVINHHEPDGQTPEPPPQPALPELPEPSEEALQRAAELLVEQTVGVDNGQETDALDEDDPLPDVLMPEASEPAPKPPAKSAKRKGK